MMNISESFFYLSFNNKKLIDINDIHFSNIWYKATAQSKIYKTNIEIWHYSNFEYVHRKITTLIYKPKKDK